MTSKSSPPEELDNRIFRGYCGVEKFSNLGPFHIKLKAHAEKEEIPENEQRESRLLGYIAENDPVLGIPKSWKGKMPRRQRQST